jgi:hypothetical protein
MEIIPDAFLYGNISGKQNGIVMKPEVQVSSGGGELPFYTMPHKMKNVSL